MPDLTLFPFFVATPDNVRVPFATEAEARRHADILLATWPPNDERALAIVVGLVLHQARQVTSAHYEMQALERLP